MPLYGYACDSCGPFEAWWTIDQAANPRPCPACDRMARRQVAAPMLALMHQPLRTALERSDRSASEPRVVPRRHLQNCGCKMCGSKRAPGSRPWALGH